MTKELELFKKWAGIIGVRPGFEEYEIVSADLSDVLEGKVFFFCKNGRVLEHTIHPDHKDEWEQYVKEKKE